MRTAARRVAETRQSQTIDLPPPLRRSAVSVEEALRSRRSAREYRRGSLGLAEVSQLLWAAQGQTGGEGLRTAPSAGARYPLRVYVVAGAVDGLADGVYAYDSRHHRLRAVDTGDRRPAMARAAVGQTWMADAPAILAFTAVFGRTTSRYGPRGDRYVHMEVGHAAQNVYLQATAMGLGTTFVGAFHDDDVAALLPAGPDERPLGLMPVGRTR